jgi:hypothetical protein
VTCRHNYVQSQPLLIRIECVRHLISGGGRFTNRRSTEDVAAPLTTQTQPIGRP